VFRLLHSAVEQVTEQQVKNIVYYSRCNYSIAQFGFQYSKLHQDNCSHWNSSY
jgi:hypothetical protein